jgi:hemolysin III
VRVLEGPAGPSAEDLKPLLRGVLHQCAFFLSLVVGAVLVATASSALARWSGLVFAASVTAMFGASALYHRGSWAPRKRQWLRRLDHAMIFLLIAGTYTPVGLHILSGPWQVIVLTVVWIGAALAIAIRLLWTDGPRWIPVTIAVALGWVAVLVLPQLVRGIAPAGVALLLAGGLLYTLGSVVYARKSPNPLPTVYGFHEVFHTLVIAAAACQYVAIAFFVLTE